MKFKQIKFILAILLMLPAFGCSNSMRRTLGNAPDTFSNLSKGAQKLTRYSNIMISPNIIAKNMPDPANSQKRIVTLKKTREVITVNCKTYELIGKTQQAVEYILRKETSEMSKEEELSQKFIQLACEINDSFK